MRFDGAKMLMLFVFPVFSAGCYEAERHTETATFSDDVQSLSVDIGTGDVTLRGADVSDVAVSARIEGTTNHLGHGFNDGKLTLVDDCHESHCSVDLTATVPAGVALEVRTGSGDLLVVGMLGAIALHTGSGDIDGRGLAGTDLVADTGSGDVALGIADPAERVHVKTGSGDVLLDVPGGSYDLRVGTGSGDRSFSGLVDDPSATSVLEVTTGSGDVTIRGH